MVWPKGFSRSLINNSVWSFLTIRLISILLIVRNDQTILSTEGVKSDLIFFIRQTGDNDCLHTFNVSAS